MTAEMQTQTVILSRRSFLVSSGAVGVAVAFGSVPRQALAATPSLTANAWITIDSKGVVTIMSPSSEMGQGVMTSLPSLVAEDLDADWHKVRIVQSPDNEKIYGNPAFGGALITVGSSAVTGYYDKLRLAGAQARKILLANAAERWKVPVSELTTEPGMVVHKKSGRKVGYGTLAKHAKVPDPLPQATKADLKPLAQCRYIGKDIMRVDVPLKVNGTAKYGIDTELPNMLFAAVLHPPVQGEKPLHIDDSAAKGVKGIVKIMALPHAVAIVGDTVEGTKKAKAKLKVTWSKEAPARKYSSDKIAADYTAIARDWNQKGVEMLKEGDASAAVTGAAKVIAADYVNDHVAHMCMEPMNATAIVKGDRVELWASNQSPTAMHHICAHAAGTTPDKVKVHTPFLGGGFGRRTDGDEVHEVVLIAKTMPGRPIKLIWSREDDVQNDKYRPLAAQRIEVGLDGSGNIVGWRHRIVCESYFARSQPHLLEKLHGKDRVSGGGGEFNYAVPTHLVEYVRTIRGVGVGAWRGISPGYTKFAVETMVDEVAAAKGVDPVAFRIELLKNDPRAAHVVETVAKMADWGKKRSGRAVGLAYSDALHSKTAAAVEVSIDEKTGAIKVHQVWAAVDPGIVLQPRNVHAQMESAMTFGLGAALVEQINIENGEVDESNFGEYSVLRMADVPPMEIKVISTDNHPTGIGEAGVPIIAPAIANAVARLTGGKRLRQLPMLPERVKAVLKA
jgi:isoquinoline 1-oxidoreductase beta subunit